jgi:hypothetical protein
MTIQPGPLGGLRCANPPYGVTHLRRIADVVFRPKQLLPDLRRTGKTDSPVQPLRQKYSPFTSDPNHLHTSRRLVPLEGRLAIVTDAGRDAVDAGDVKRRVTWPADGEAVWS